MQDKLPPAKLTPSVILALASVYLIWGSTYFVMRMTFATLPPFTGSGSRFIIAGSVLLCVLKARGAAWPTLKQWLLALPVGTLMFLCGNGIVALTGRGIGSGVVAVVAATMPLFAAGILRFFGEKLSLREIAALGIGFLGVAVLATGKDLQANPWMTLLLFGAPLGWALGSVLARRLPLAPGLMTAATQMVTGGCVMFFVGLALGERVPDNVQESTWWAFSYLVLVGSLAAFSAYSYLLRHVRPTLAMSYAYVNPVIAVAIGHVFGAESILPQSIVATLLIVLAVMLAVRK
jgi:drug/metabolite transporter (DMT)-like permease